MTMVVMIWDLFQKGSAVLPCLRRQQGFCLLHLQQENEDHVVRRILNKGALERKRRLTCKLSISLLLLASSSNSLRLNIAPAILKYQVQSCNSGWQGMTEPGSGQKFSFRKSANAWKAKNGVKVGVIHVVCPAATGLEKLLLSTKSLSWLDSKVALHLTHPMFCVSRLWPEFGWVIRIQNAPDDFVPGTVPLRQKNAGGEVPLIFLYQVQCP